MINVYEEEALQRVKRQHEINTGIPANVLFGPKPLYKKISADEYERMTARIDELQSENAELKEERRWRKFSEEKPDHHQWILVFYPNHSQFTTGVELRRWDDGCKYDVEVQEIYEKWMPLPSDPKEEK